MANKIFKWRTMEDVYQFYDTINFLVKVRLQVIISYFGYMGLVPVALIALKK